MSKKLTPEENCKHHCMGCKKMTEHQLGTLPSGLGRFVNCIECGKSGWNISECQEEGHR